MDQEIKAELFDFMIEKDYLIGSSDLYDKKFQLSNQGCGCCSYIEFEADTLEEILNHLKEKNDQN